MGGVARSRGEGARVAGSAGGSRGELTANRGGRLRSCALPLSPVIHPSLLPSRSPPPAQELWTDGLVRPDDLALPPEAFSYERSVADATAAAAGLLVASGAAPPSALPRTTAPPPPPVAAATTATPGMEGG